MHPRYTHYQECPEPDGQDFGTALETHTLPPGGKFPHQCRREDTLIRCAHCFKVLQGIDWSADQNLVVDDRDLVTVLEALVLEQCRPQSHRIG